LDPVRELPYGPAAIVGIEKADPVVGYRKPDHFGFVGETEIETDLTMNVAASLYAVSENTPSVPIDRRTPFAGLPLAPAAASST
jgi:hypothetical protein